MHIRSAVFVKSCPKPDDLPHDHRPQVACFGRSNVGKSTLINCLTQSSTLSRVSRTPGRTEYLNIFLVNSDWYLVDLPGYGYAKQPKEKRVSLETLIYDYLRTKPTLALVIIDSNIGPTVLDTETLSFLAAENIPHFLIANKIDKQSNNVRTNTIHSLKKNFPSAKIFVTSAKTGTGRGELLDAIDTVIFHSKLPEKTARPMSHRNLHLEDEIEPLIL